MPPPPFQYQSPYYTTPAPPPRTYPSPSSALLIFARTLTLLVPGIILILTIWWAATRAAYPAWLLYLTLPIAAASFLYALAESISARRALHRMSHIPRPVDVVIRGILAGGVTVCFALLVEHMVRWDVWSVGAESAMVALLAIMMINHLTLFAWAAFELKQIRQEQQYRDSHIGI